MTGFEPGSSGIRSDRSANCATTTAQGAPWVGQPVEILHILSVWPDWAIYCTLGNFSKACGNNYFARNAHIFVKVSKSFIFLVK